MKNAFYSTLFAAFLGGALAFGPHAAFAQTTANSQAMVKSTDQKMGDNARRNTMMRRSNSGETNITVTARRSDNDEKRNSMRRRGHDDNRNGWGKRHHSKREYCYMKHSRHWSWRLQRMVVENRRVCN